MVVALVGFLMVILGAVGIFYSAFLFVFGRRPRARKTFIWSSTTVVFGVVVFVVAASIWMPEEEEQAAAIQVEQVAQAIPKQEEQTTPKRAKKAVEQDRPIGEPTKADESSGGEEREQKEQVPKTPIELAESWFENRSDFQYATFDDGVLKVVIKPTSIWDERDLAGKGVRLIIEHSDEVFSSFPEVSMYRVIVLAELTREDMYGNREVEVEPVVKIGVSRELNDKANWSNLSCKYKKVLAIVDELDMHPIVASAVLLGSKGCWAN